MASNYEFILILLTKFSLLYNIINQPPSDFASLVNTKEALAACDLEYNEQSLIKYLKKGLADLSDEEIEAAYVKLGSGKALERKAARAVLTKAGTSALPYIKKGISSPAPEIRDACQKISRIIALEKF